MILVFEPNFMNNHNNLVAAVGTALFAGGTVRVSEGPTYATVRMTTTSGKYKPRSVMSEGKANERRDSTEMSETTTAL